jgi:hypothetical protein
MKIPITDNTKTLADYALLLFRKHYDGQVVRHIGVTMSKLVYTDSYQLNLFESPEEQLDERNRDRVIDRIRQKYGFTAILHANNLTDGARCKTKQTLRWSRGWNG